MSTPSLSRCRDRSPVPSGRAAGLSARTLRQQNRAFRGTGGVSAENRALGFAPAFLDTQTGAVYRACFADGRPAPMHLLEGLPPDAGSGARCGRPGDRDPPGRDGRLRARRAVLHPRPGRRPGPALKPAG